MKVKTLNHRDTEIIMRRFRDGAVMGHAALRADRYDALSWPCQAPLPRQAGGGEGWRQRERKPAKREKGRLAASLAGKSMAQIMNSFHPPVQPTLSNRLFQLPPERIAAGHDAGSMSIWEVLLKGEKR